jgi:hypothetical protein
VESLTQDTKGAIRDLDFPMKVCMSGDKEKWMEALRNGKEVEFTILLSLFLTDFRMVIIDSKL